MPHVVFVNRVYPPAGGATGGMLAEMAGALVDAGWDVTVLTGPAGDAPASEVTEGGVRVERVGAASFSRESTIRRAWAYVSLFPAFLARALQLPPPDVVVTKTDPPMLKVLGPVLGRLTGATAVHWAQDLYPEVAEELGVIAKGGLLAGLLRRMSTWALRHHDHVVAVGRCMKQRITERGVHPASVTVVPNWPPGSVAPRPHARNPFRDEHDLTDRFVVMYSGNMGLAHTFDPVVDAADRLETAAPDVLFLFVGDGPQKSDLQAEVEARQLDNVRFLPFQPYDRLPESLSAADLHLVTMQADLWGLVVPSKIYGCLQAGCPALFLGPRSSEAAHLIQEHDCGEVLPDATGPVLARTVQDWQQDPEHCRRAGARAHAAVQDQQSTSAAEFERVLRRVLSSDAAASAPADISQSL